MKKGFLFFILITNISIVCAQSRIRANQYAQEYGIQLMNTKGTSDAKNCQTEITDFEIDGQDYVMEIDVKWDDKAGAIFIDNVVCQIKGVLTIKFDGTNKRFSQTYKNSAFDEIDKGKRNGTILSGLVGAALSSKSSSSQSTTQSSYSSSSNSESRYQYNIKNEDTQKVKFYLAEYESGLGKEINLLSIEPSNYYNHFVKYGNSWSYAFIRIITTSNTGSNIVKEYKIYPGNFYSIKYNPNGYYDIYE